MRRDIYVHPSVDALDTRLKYALERLAPVRFKNCNAIADRRRGDALLCLSGDAEALSALQTSEADYFHIAERKATPRSEEQNELVCFSDSRQLDPLLRGRRLAQRKLGDFTPVTLRDGDEVLAEYGGQPIWALRPSAHGSGHVVATPLPRFAADEQALDYLNGLDFILLLPLLHFLRQASRQFAWKPPKLRACLTFDDPNLHGLTYGCLSYPAIVERAKRDKFHVAIATVPADAWAAHPGAVALFKENSDQLSLLIHGNNHTREEYGQTRDPKTQLALVSQSLNRIERFERSTGLRVERAIVPPHEALTDAAAAALLALGVEGASLATWSLRHWNRVGLSAEFGVELADILASGFPCLGRYSLTEDCEGPAVISAFLGRPVILVEHHKGLARGHELLSTVASVINSLGDVHWCGVEALLRSNYLHRQEGRKLRIRPYSSRIELVVPEGVEELDLDVGHGERCESYRLIRGFQPAIQDESSLRSFPVTPGETIQLTSLRLGAEEPFRGEPATFSVGAFSRRLACEARDRWAGYRARVWKGEQQL